MMETTTTTTEVKWKKDPLREVLKKDIQEGRITPEMKPAEAIEVRPEWKAMGKTFASRLAGMRKSLANVKPPKSPRWDNKNHTRRQMKWDIADGIITEGMSNEDAQKVRKLYECMDPAKFKSRLLSMHKAIQEAKKRASADEASLLHDRLLYPRPTHNHRGEPLWVDHEASELLEIDVGNNFYEGKQPEELWKSRLQYKDFLLETFRGHLYQEIQTQKWRLQWVDGKKHYAIVPEPHWTLGDEEEQEE